MFAHWPIYANITTREFQGELLWRGLNSKPGTLWDLSCLPNTSFLLNPFCQWSAHEGHTIEPRCTPSGVRLCSPYNPCHGDTSSDNLGQKTGMGVSRGENRDIGIRMSHEACLRRRLSTKVNIVGKVAKVSCVLHIMCVCSVNTAVEVSGGSDCTLPNCLLHLAWSSRLEVQARCRVASD